MITLFSEEQIMEAYEKELREDARKEVAQRLIGMGFPDDGIAYACELSMDEIDSIRKEMGK